MSKMDDLRAMREARYAEVAARSGARPAGQEPAGRPAAVAQAAPTPRDAAEPALCGHRAISGRLCTRERGHSARNHRYS